MVRVLCSILTILPHFNSQQVTSLLNPWTQVSPMPDGKTCLFIKGTGGGRKLLYGLCEHIPNAQNKITNDNLSLSQWIHSPKTGLIKLRTKNLCLAMPLKFNQPLKSQKCDMENNQQKFQVTRHKSQQIRLHSASLKTECFEAKFEKVPSWKKSSEVLATENLQCSPIGPGFFLSARLKPFIPEGMILAPDSANPDILRPKKGVPPAKMPNEGVILLKRDVDAVENSVGDNENALNEFQVVTAVEKIDPVTEKPNVRSNIQQLLQQLRNPKTPNPKPEN